MVVEEEENLGGLWGRLALPVLADGAGAVGVAAGTAGPTSPTAGRGLLVAKAVKCSLTRCAAFQTSDGSTKTLPRRATSLPMLLPVSRCMLYGRTSRSCK